MDYLEIIKTENVLFDFYADWCAPCRSLSPIIDNIKSDDYKVIKINVENDVELSASLGIRQLPTLLFFFNGEKHIIKSRTLDTIENELLLIMANEPKNQ